MVEPPLMDQIPTAAPHAQSFLSFCPFTPFGFLEQTIEYWEYRALGCFPFRFIADICPTDCNHFSSVSVTISHIEILFYVNFVAKKISIYFQEIELHSHTSYFLLLFPYELAGSITVPIVLP